jgi:hypothetical protein
MKNPNPFRSHARRVIASVVIALATLVIVSQSVLAAGWNGIEPLKSRRADVERILGHPVQEQTDGTLHFKVAGGTVSISFVNAHFVASKKLYSEYEGTVLEIVLQHEKSSDTPESMGLSGKSNFARDEMRGGTIFRNLKDGISYAFFNGKLSMTYYTPSSTTLGRARKG